MSNAERLMLKEEVDVRIPPNFVAWSTESNFLALASCFCTVFLLDTSDLILLKIRHTHPFSEGVKSKWGRRIGTHIVHIQLRRHCIPHSE